ncbi:ferric reductase-like transmembrane domain-containing protein [Aquisalimonas sp.]|uniref:ferredoxin reductase family protein n=1 Tax=unclassified Aquisalimonas TaxID=2644645 RepID=UPI0025C20F72|nr:ferric reductase-like transmembrane domain-containing protein [Aquisalimonas sp.]
MPRSSVRPLWLLPAALLGGYAALALLPMALGAAQGLTPRPWRDDLATGLGMSGFAMLLMEFLLSGRFKGLSARMGMDRVMQFHQIMAYVLVAFLLLHPFLYTLPMGAPAPLDRDAHTWLSLPLLPGLSGLLAWIALGLLVFMAIARDGLPMRYETWRLSHGIGAVVIALFGLHHTLEAGRYSQDGLLAGFWILAALVAIASLVHVHLIIPLRQRRHPYRVTAVRPEAERTWTIELEPDRKSGHPGTPLPFRAGQFAWLKLERPLFRMTEHPFSISSAPADWPRVAFTIKEAGDFTGRIAEVPPGTPAYLDGPYGHFTLEPEDGRALVFVAGGVGMAPIMALLRQLQHDGADRPITVIQGNRTAGQILYADELDAMAGTLPLTVHHVLAEPPDGWTGHRGVPDRALLETVLPAERRTGAVYYLCGPPAMTDALEETLLSDFGVPASQVIAERFRYTLGGRRSSARRLVYGVLGTAAVILVGIMWFAGA